mgnify:CR=1 FL=1|jgi:hypothetical protein
MCWVGFKIESIEIPLEGYLPKGARSAPRRRLGTVGPRAPGRTAVRVRVAFVATTTKTEVVDTAFES